MALSRKTAALASLTLAFAGVVGYSLYENREDVARKPESATMLIDAALPLRPALPAGDTNARYDARLNAILLDCRTDDLDTLKAHGVIVVLDRRLGAQANSFWGTDIQAAYYERGDRKILSLWDDGTMPGDGSFWGQDPYDYNASLIEKLATELRKGRTSETMFGAHYSNGKTAWDDWKPAEDFSSLTRRKNPDLMNPPALNAPAPARNPAPGFDG